MTEEIIEFDLRRYNAIELTPGYQERWQNAAYDTAAKRYTHYDGCRKLITIDASVYPINAILYYNAEHVIDDVVWERLAGSIVFGADVAEKLSFLRDEDAVYSYMETPFDRINYLVAGKVQSITYDSEKNETRLLFKPRRIRHDGELLVVEYEE